MANRIRINAGPKLRINRRGAFLFACTVLFAVRADVSVAASQQDDVLPPALHALALSSIDRVYKEEFREAYADAKKMIKEYPDHPAGYFFVAAVLDARMEYAQTDKDEEEFYRYCDLAISKGEMLLEKKGDIWVRFFIGGAHGERGTYESRYGRWITAFRYGWQGVTVFSELIESHPGLNDPRFGVATYDYWRSAMMKMLWWMPGVEDKRSEAIQALNDVMKSSVYVREAAAKHLVPILNNEKLYDQALAVADKMLKRYPGNLAFLWGKGEALLGAGLLSDAENVFKNIQQRVETQETDNNYNKALCHYYLAKVYLARHNASSCVYECNAVESLEIDVDTKKRLESQLSEVALIKKKAHAQERKGNQEPVGKGR